MFLRGINIHRCVAPVTFPLNFGLGVIAPVNTLNKSAHLSFSTVSKPSVRPESPNFSSGPTKKRPGYELGNLPIRNLGRSHRSKLGLGTLEKCIDLQKEILDLPDGYQLGLVPASDTGAFEMAMWSLLGPRPVDILQWESFGKGWVTDITQQLKLKNVQEYSAEYGELPDFSKVDFDHDVVFTWNGTTSGAMVPNADWIPEDRKGLTLCDATSGIFNMKVDIPKCDVVTYSWQKALGGEGAHGVLILSPRAVERLESYTPTWPMPKIFRITKNGKISNDVFVGKVINTPSMICIEDCIDALEWSKSIGGLQGLIQRSTANFNVLEKFILKENWIDFLVKDPSIRSNTSVCVTLDLPADQIKPYMQLLEAENVAYDIGAYKTAPPGLRIWCGSTVEEEDVQALTEWLRWAYYQVKSDYSETIPEKTQIKSHV